jgi:glycosyltransferase involved in cell wall biosynthesis
MRVVVAHEWLVRYAGSERVVEEILRTFPDARLMTTVVEPGVLPSTLDRAEPSFLQHIPAARRHHEWFVPLMPLAWRLRAPVRDADAVISSSHACAKAVRAAPDVPHLCYCHTPMRYAWDFDAEEARFPAVVRPLAKAGMVGFRRWDRSTAASVDAFIANSSAVAERIARFYGRAAQIIHPPVRTDYFFPEGERGDDFLYVGRLIGYKRPELVVKAFTGLEQRLLVVGDGQLGARLRSSAPPNVRFLGTVDDRELRALYRSARALVYPAVEDFGIALAEAQACGTPVIGVSRGGARDIVEDGITGWLLPEPSVESLRDAVRRAATEELDAAVIRRKAQRFAPARFRSEIAAALDELLSRPRSRGGATSSRRDAHRR